MQLDLKGGVEGEVSMIIAAAPFSPVTAVVDINVQSDCLLLWDRCSCVVEEGKEVERQEGQNAKGAKRKGDGWRDGPTDRGVGAEVVWW